MKQIDPISITQNAHRLGSSPWQEPGKGEDDLISLDQIFSVLRRRYKLIGSVMLVVTALGVAISMLMTPRYTATAQIKIQPATDRVVSEAQALNEVSADDAFIDSEIEVMRSPDVISRVVDEYGLVDDPEWNPALRPQGVFGGLKSLLKGALRGGGNNNAADEAAIVKQRVVRNVAEAYSVRRVGLTYVVRVSVQSESPTRAAELANGLAQVYLQTQVEQQFSTAEEANSWLSTRLDQLRLDVQEKEKAVQEYRVEKGLLTAKGASLVEAQIADVQTSVVEARAEYAEKMARYNQVMSLIRRGGSVESIAGVLNSEVIRELRVREADVAQRQADLENQFGPKYPAVEKVRLERRDIQNQIEAEISRIAESLKNEAEVVRTRLRTLEANLGAVRNELAGNNKNLVRLNELETEANAARRVYESFLERFHEVADQGKLASVDAKIVSMAQRPLSPSHPNFKLNVAVSFVIGALLALGIVLVIETMQNSLVSAEEVESKIGLPAIASVPELKEKDLKFLPEHKRHPSAYLLAKPMSPFAEAFRVIRTSIRFSRGASSRKVIGVTSALPGDGKTTISLGLARTVALSDHRVMVVDCDTRRASLTNVLSIKPEIDVLDVLSGQSSWRRAALLDKASGAHVIPARVGGFSPEEVFASEAMDKMVAELSEEYDLVILDCAPVLALAEVREVMAHADGVVMACRWGKSNARTVSAAVTQLRRADVNIIGMVLNGVDMSAIGRYSYNDSLYYRESARYYQSS